MILPQIWFEGAHWFYSYQRDCVGTAAKSVYTLRQSRATSKCVTDRDRCTDMEILGIESLNVTCATDGDTSVAIFMCMNRPLPPTVEPKFKCGKLATISTDATLSLSRLICSCMGTAQKSSSRWPAASQGVICDGHCRWKWTNTSSSTMVPPFSQNRCPNMKCPYPTSLYFPTSQTQAVWSVLYVQLFCFSKRCLEKHVRTCHNNEEPAENLSQDNASKRVKARSRIYSMIYKAIMSSL